MVREPLTIILGALESLWSLLSLFANEILTLLVHVVSRAQNNPIGTLQTHKFETSFHFVSTGIYAGFPGSEHQRFVRGRCQATRGEHLKSPEQGEIPELDMDLPIRSNYFIVTLHYHQCRAILKASSLTAKKLTVSKPKPKRVSLSYFPDNSVWPPHRH